MDSAPAGQERHLLSHAKRCRFVAGVWAHMIEASVWKMTVGRPCAFESSTGIQSRGQGSFGMIQSGHQRYSVLSLRSRLRTPLAATAGGVWTGHKGGMSSSSGQRHLLLAAARGCRASCVQLRCCRRDFARCQHKVGLGGRLWGNGYVVHGALGASPRIMQALRQPGPPRRCGDPFLAVILARTPLPPFWSDSPVASSH